MADWVAARAADFVPGQSVVSVEKIVVDGGEGVVLAGFGLVAAAPTGRGINMETAMRLTVAGERIVRMHL